MTSTRFDPEADLAPLPFDERICRKIPTELDPTMPFMILIAYLESKHQERQKP